MPCDVVLPKACSSLDPCPTDATIGGQIPSSAAKETIFLYHIKHEVSVVAGTTLHPI